MRTIVFSEAVVFAVLAVLCFRQGAFCWGLFFIGIAAGMLVLIFDRPVWQSFRNDREDRQ